MVLSCFSGTEETEGCVCTTGHGPLPCGGLCFCPPLSLPDGVTMAMGLHTGVMTFFFSYGDVKGHSGLSGSI